MFRDISASDINGNLVEMISTEYMLISAGDKKGYNMMTASWGYAGEMWGSDSVVIAVRPTRYTLEYLRSHDRFTISFYGDNRDVHKICGSKSGRDCDKTALCGLTPVFDDGSVYFDEARLVIVCEKQYMSQLDPENFTDKKLLDWYKSNDYHFMIVGKIVKVLEKKQ